MSSSRRQSQEDEEVDVVEMKKAIATGAKESPVTSSRAFPALPQVARMLRGDSVPPIVCYCLASILMTVVNKVRANTVTHNLYSSQSSLWSQAGSST